MIYFDLGNVLFTFDNGLEELAKLLNTTLNEIKPIFLKHDNAICKGELTPTDLLKIYEDYFRTETGFENFTEFWASFFHPIEEMQSLLLSLKERGHEIGILTNIYPGILTEIFERKIIPPSETYSAIVQSCEIGHVKPQESIYIC